MMDILGAMMAASRRRCGRAGGPRAASCWCPTSPAGWPAGRRPSRAAAAGRRRRGRGRHPLLRPGDGRSRHPGGHASRRWRRGHARRHRRRPVPPRRRHPAGGDDVLQPGVPGRARALRPLAGRRRRAPAPSCPTCRSRSAAPWCEAADAAGVETVMLAAPTAPDERLPAYLRSVPRVRVRRRAARRHRRAGPAGRQRHAHRPAAEGRHRPSPCSSASACRTPSRPPRPSRVADGVIQGASVVRRLMDGGPEAVGAYVAEVRAAIDARERGDSPWRGNAVIAECERSRLTAICVRRRASPRGSTRTTCAGSPSARSAPCRWWCGRPTTPSRPTDVKAGSTHAWPRSSSQHFSVRALRRRPHAQHPRPLPRPRPAPGRVLRSRAERKA